MAHGKNAEKWGNRREWWSRRPFAGVGHGGRAMKSWKRLLHKLERKQGKDLTEYTEEIWDHRTWWDVDGL